MSQLGNLRRTDKRDNSRDLDRQGEAESLNLGVICLMSLNLVLFSFAMSEKKQ